MRLNPEMVILAREFDGMTQSDVSRMTGLTQARIARIEAGAKANLSDDEVAVLAAKVRFPPEFFYLPEVRIGYGTSSVFTRTRALTAKERRRINSEVNLRRIQIKRMLDHVDIQGDRTIPRLDLDEYKTPSAAAQALRASWRIPQGPIRDMTKLLESAGVLIVECDFQAAPMDATSVQVAEMPPLIFINKHVPTDRWRFTLAHELAHLVLHEMPRPSMEGEADEFASEFLVPSAEIAPMLTRLKAAKLDEYIELKRYWKVSIAALIMKAEALRKIDANQKKWLYIQMSKLGIRRSEPAPIERESPKLFPAVVKYFRDELGFNDQDFGAAICFLPERLKELYAAASSEKPRLSVVR